MVTDRDLALAVLGGDLDPDKATLAEIMSEGVVTCDIDASIDDAARLMEENRIRRIPLTEDRRLAGFLTFDDLVLDGSVEIARLRRIITEQLEVETPTKPAPNIVSARDSASERESCGHISRVSEGQGSRRGDLQPVGERCHS